MLSLKKLVYCSRNL